MTLKYKIYIAAVGVVLVVFASYSAASHFQIKRQEAEIEYAKTKADSFQQIAVSKEMEAAEYTAKIAYLERQLADIQMIKRRQDEELEKTYVNTRRARADVKRTRGVRTIDTTADELCAKLAEIGRGCQ